MRINVCFIIDNNYIKHLAVTIISILKNALIDDELYFYILENNLYVENKEKILELKKIKQCQINFISLSDKIFKDVPNYNLQYITKTAYYRFLIAEILKDVDKIIYLDSDIIVLSSLEELFSVDVRDYYLAAVYDICYYFYNKIHDTNYVDFVNSGVLLMNLKLWREENIFFKLLNITIKNGNKFPFGDQEAINIACGKKIKLLSLSWNVQNTFFEINNLLYHPLKKDIIKSFRNIKIIHYTSAKKPWNSFVPLQKYYMKYSKLSPFIQSIDLKTKIKKYTEFGIYFFMSLFYILKFVLSPIINIYMENLFVKVKVLSLLEIKLYKKY